jgi:antitoxin YefM
MASRSRQIVPIDLWREIESERETACLLKSKTMRKRLLEAKKRSKGIPLEKVRAKLGI